MEPRPFVESFFEEIDSMRVFSAPLPHTLADGAGPLYRLHFNESAYGASPKVHAAVQEALQTIGMYPDMRDNELREKLASVYRRGFTPDHFYTSSSGYEALELAARAFFRPGDEVIVMEPTFLVYRRLVQLCRATLVNVPLLEPDFAPDIDALLAAITPKTRAIVLCNPNNPTGTITTADQMKHLMDNLPDHVVVISDEVYFHFVRDEHFPDAMQYVLDGKNIVLIHSFSKGYGMAGMRMGYAIAPEKIAGYVRKHYRGFHLNSLQLAAGLAALDDPQQLEKNVNAGIEGRHYFYEQFDRLDLRYWESQTNFVLAEAPCPSAEIVSHMRQEGVLIGRIGDHYPNHIRISTGTPQANQACIKALEKALREVMS